MPATLDDDALLAGFTAGRLRAFTARAGAR